MLRIKVPTKILRYNYHLYKIFYCFENIFISFCPKNMILSGFWRVIRGVQKFGLNWQAWSTTTSLLAVLRLDFTVLLNYEITVRNCIHLWKVMGFFKSQPKKFASPFTQLSDLVKGKAKVTKNVRAFSCLWYPGLLSKINVKAEAKVSVVFRGNAKFINTDTYSGKGWNIWERMLCLHDARWKARCAESVQLSFGLYEWEYSNDFLPYGKGEKIFTRKISPHIISISKIIVACQLFPTFWLVTSQKAEKWAIYLPKKIFSGWLLMHSKILIFKVTEPAFLNLKLLHFFTLFDCFFLLFPAFTST